MTSNDDKTTELRRRAEKRLRMQLQDPRKISPQDLPELIHELQVYQIELEMQNEELRRAQAELSATHDGYADLYEFAPVGYLTLDDKNLITEANLAAVQLLVQERKQLLNRPFFEFVADDDKDTCYRHFRQLRQTEARHTSDLRMCKSDGGIFWVRLDSSSCVDSAGNLLRLRLSLTDITRLKDVENRLEGAREITERSLAQLRAVFDNTNVGLVFGDAEGNLTEWNSAALELLGLDNIQEGRRHIKGFADNFEIYSRDGQLVPFKNWPMLRVLRGEEFVNYEFRMHRTDTGLDRIINTSGVCIREENGEIVLGLLTLHDLTAIRATEAALRKATEAAVTANAAKTRFLNAVSHDLRQPLQTVKLLSSILFRKVSEPGTAAIVKDQQVALDTMVEILNRLLDVSQLESGSIAPRHIDFPVAHLIEKLAKEMQGQVRLKGLELRRVPVVATIHSDPALLEQILRNLLSNAIRYTKRGGVLVGCRRRGENLSIEIWDTGIGIPKDQQDLIFEEFYQVDNPAREARKGQGLGLFIARQTARLLGLSICVRSLLGKGSKFAIEAPLAEPSDRSPGY